MSERDCAKGIRTCLDFIMSAMRKLHIMCPAHFEETCIYQETEKPAFNLPGDLNTGRDLALLVKQWVDTFSIKSSFFLGQPPDYDESKA